MDKDVALMGPFFTLEECLTVFLSSKTQHYLLLHVPSYTVLRLVYDILIGLKNKSNRVGVLFKVQRGPNEIAPEINPYALLGVLSIWPVNVRLTFGFATQPGPIHEYAKREIRELEETMATYKKMLDQRFVIEFDAFYITRRFTLFTDVEFVRRAGWLVLIRAPKMNYAIDINILSRLVCFFNPWNVYLDVPKPLRKRLDLSCYTAGSGQLGSALLVHTLAIIPACIINYLFIKYMPFCFPSPHQVPAWLTEMIEHHTWRSLIYRLAEEYPDCLMLNFTIKLISDAGFQSEITSISTAAQQIEVFSRVLKTTITKFLTNPDEVQSTILEIAVSTMGF